MRILFAEDDQKLGKHIEQALKAEGYAVDRTLDGEETLWLAENYSYDIIILDIMMPQRDGISIVRSIRRKNINTPVLIVTAWAEVDDRVRGLDAGADIIWLNLFRLWSCLPEFVHYCAAKDPVHQM